MNHGTPVESASTLEAQLRYLARHFTIVPLESVISGFGNNQSASSNEIVLTFDDGLRNNLTVVYPILRALSMPATFFVCPGLIGSGKWLWNHAVRCRLRALTQQRLHDLSRQLQATGNSVEEIVEWMKTLALQKRCQAEETIRLAAPDFNPTDAQREAYDIMSWEDLHSLDPKLNHYWVAYAQSSDPALADGGRTRIRNCVKAVACWSKG